MSESFADAKAAALRRPYRQEITVLLKAMRQNKIREPRLVVEMGSLALSKFAGGLGDERWVICEQVFVAALDTGNDALANSCLATLMDKFPESSRVKRLVGIQCEAKAQYPAASETYAELLEANPANALAMKRRVAVLKGQGKVKEAVKTLNAFVDQFQSDVTAWQELAGLYLSMSKYDAAAFCFEECILHDPMNHMLHCRLAEVYYTLGDYPTARKYFAQALEIKKTGNVRSLHGLAACCNAIAESSKLSKEQRGRSEVNEALHSHAASELASLYSKEAPALLPALEKVLEMQTAALEKGK